MDEGADDVGEVRQFLEVADCVPVHRFDPLIRVHRLILPINAQIFASLQEEVVLFGVDFFQPDCHHETEQQFVLLKEPPAGISVDAGFEFISNGIKFLIETVIEPRFFYVLLDGFLEKSNIGVEGKLVHGVDEGEIVDNEEEFGGHLCQLLIVLPGQINFFHLGNRRLNLMPHFFFSLFRLLQIGDNVLVVNEVGLGR